MDSSTTPKSKFTDILGNPCPYGAVYERQQVGNKERIAISTEMDEVSLLIELMRIIEPPYRALWVLLIPRTGAREGRYQSPTFSTREHLESFLNSYASFFENDARHNFWVLNPSTGPLVLDRHGLIYAYGDLDSYETVAKRLGRVPGRVSIPDLHIHSYNDQFDADERRLINEFDWIVTDLVDSDES